MVRWLKFEQTFIEWTVRSPSKYGSLFNARKQIPVVELKQFPSRVVALRIGSISGSDPEHTKAGGCVIYIVSATYMVVTLMSGVLGGNSWCFVLFRSVLWV